MKRSWEFSGAPVREQELRVVLDAAVITQKTAFVSFQVQNTSKRTLAVEVGSFTLRLPDGTAFVGKTSFVDRAYDGAKGLLETMGWIDKSPKPGLAPGKSLSVALAFRQYGRDLRRIPELRVELDGISVEGRALRAAPLVLHAPKEAPIGEDI